MHFHISLEASFDLRELLLLVANYFGSFVSYAYQAIITLVFLISLKCLSPQDLLGWCFGFRKLNPLEKANLATEADHHRKH